MNLEEYKKWKKDAYNALRGRYSHEQATTIVDWFDTIKGRDERDMVGNEVVDAHLVYSKPRGKFDLYASLMSRAFVYAPFILEQ